MLVGRYVLFFYSPSVTWSSSFALTSFYGPPLSCIFLTSCVCHPASLQNQLFASFEPKFGDAFAHVLVTFLKGACVKSSTWWSLIWSPLQRDTLKLELQMPASFFSLLFFLVKMLMCVITECSEQTRRSCGLSAVITWSPLCGYNMAFVVVPVIVNRPDISLVYFKPIYGICPILGFFSNSFLSKGSIAWSEATEHGQSGVM